MSACNGGGEGATTVPGDESATEIVTTTGPAPTTEPAPATDDVTTTEPPPITTNLATTTTLLVRADVLELVGCERIGIGTLVDPVMARGCLPDSEPLIVQDSAPFTLQAMSCDDLVTDGL